MSELETLQQNVRDLAGYVQVIAKAVLAKADDSEDEDDKDVEKALMGKNDPMAPPMGDGMGDDLGYGEDEDEGMGMEDENPMAGPPMGAPQDEELNQAYKSLKRAKARIASIKKGYASSAKVNSDEHDAPFDEKDGSLSGNEASPAGDQGGAREDESFGQPSYKMLAKQVAGLSKQIAAMNNGTVIAKAVVPTVTDSNARKENETPVVTRDIQEQVKTLSYKQLNKFREETGDLPRHGIIG